MYHEAGSLLALKPRESGSSKILCTIANADDGGDPTSYSSPPH
jgi:hypothetical protein